MLKTFWFDQILRPPPQGQTEVSRNGVKITIMNRKFRILHYEGICGLHGRLILLG